jgi:hypothetical protein
MIDRRLLVLSNPVRPRSAGAPRGRHVQGALPAVCQRLRRQLVGQFEGQAEQGRTAANQD